MNYRTTDIVDTTYEIFHYLYFENQYYVATLKRSRYLNCLQETLRFHNEVNLRIFLDLDEMTLSQFAEADGVATNIGRRTRLFSVLSRTILALKCRFTPLKEESYQNLVGLLYEPSTTVEKRSFELLKRQVLEVSLREERYPPEILAAAQMSILWAPRLSKFKTG